MERSAISPITPLIIYPISACCIEVMHNSYFYFRTNSISLQTLLRSHRQKIVSPDIENTFRIKIRRNHIWEDAYHYFKCGFSADKHLHVTFLGEPAVDAGGPLREFFHLLMRAICKNNTLFCGTETARIPNHSMIELSKKSFEHVGCMLGASIVHGGPAPAFSAHAVADYIINGIDCVKAKVEDVPDPSIKNKFKKVSSF